MTGEKKSGLYRTMGEIHDGEILFFRVRPDENGNLVVVQLEHKDNMARQVKETKQPLTDDIWKKLIPWQ